MKHFSAIDKRRIVEKIMAQSKEPNAAPLSDLCASSEITVEKFQKWKKQLGLSESFIAPETPPREKTKSERITQAIEELDALCERVLIAVETEKGVIQFQRKDGTCKPTPPFGTIQPSLLDVMTKMDPAWTVGVVGAKTK